MSTLLVPFLAFVLAGCAANPPTELSPSVVSAPSVEQSAPVAQPTTCAGRSWPPYQLGTIPGITATSTSRATLQVTNRTERTYYYRVAGWQPAQFETCTAFGEEEIEEGPIAPAPRCRSGSPRSPTELTSRSRSRSGPSGAAKDVSATRRLPPCWSNGRPLSRPRREWVVACCGHDRLTPTGLPPRTTPVRGHWRTRESAVPHSMRRIGYGEHAAARIAWWA